MSMCSVWAATGMRSSRFPHSCTRTRCASTARSTTAPSRSPTAYARPGAAAIAKRGQENIRIVFSGRFNEEQKRVSDLAKIGHGLKDRGIPFHLTLIGNGPSEAELKAAV